MDMLPVELWIKIFRRIEKHRRTLVALSRTCRQFHPIAQIELYGEVDLRWSLKYGGHNVFSETTTLFARSLEDRPELATFIHIFAYTYEGDIGRYSDSPVLCRLPAFSNLKIFRLAGFFVCLPLFSALHTLPRLRSVAIHNCAIDRTLLLAKNPHPIAAKTLDIEIWSPMSAVGWNTLVPAGVQSLTVKNLQPTWNKDTPGQAEIIFRSFIASNSTRTLTALKAQTGRNLPPNISALLVASPELRYLSLTSLEPVDPQLFASLPRNSIPRLKHFSGPVALCDILVKGRPVHTAELELHKETPHEIHRVQVSSVPIINLALSFMFPNRRGERLPEILMQHIPPSVEHFCWNHAPKESIISNVPLISHLPSLRTLRGIVVDTYQTRYDFKIVDHAVHKELVRAFFKASPSLQEISFGEHARLQDTGLEELYGRWARSGVE